MLERIKTEKDRKSFSDTYTSITIDTKNKIYPNINVVDDRKYISVTYFESVSGKIYRILFEINLTVAFKASQKSPPVLIQ